MERERVITLLRHLIHSGKITERRLDIALENLKLSATKAWTLRHLVQAGEPLPLSVLAQRMGFVRSNVTYLIDRLEANGLVRRIPDPHDRRSVLAQITEEGLRRHEDALQAVRTVEQELLECYTSEELTQIFRLLERLDETWGWADQ